MFITSTSISTSNNKIKVRTNRIKYIPKIAHWNVFIVFNSIKIRIIWINEKNKWLRTERNVIRAATDTRWQRNVVGVWGVCHFTYNTKIIKMNKMSNKKFQISLRLYRAKCIWTRECRVRAMAKATIRSLILVLWFKAFNHLEVLVCISLPPASVSRSLHLFLSISIWLCVYVCVQTKLMKNEYKRWLKEERQSLTPKPENLT